LWPIATDRGPKIEVSNKRESRLASDIAKSALRTLSRQSAVYFAVMHNRRRPQI